VYRQMGKDGLLTCLAFGAKIPPKYANKDGTVFGGVKVDEWDGFHDYVRIKLSEYARTRSMWADVVLAFGCRF